MKIGTLPTRLPGLSLHRLARGAVVMDTARLLSRGSRFVKTVKRPDSLGASLREAAEDGALAAVRVYTPCGRERGLPPRHPYGANGETPGALRQVRPVERGPWDPAMRPQRHVPEIRSAGR
jgi:hypothetical protein